MQNYFAKNIKYLRKKNNIAQSVMARDLGVAQSTLCCWENGSRNPTLDMLEKIMKYLNIHDDFISKDLTKIDNSKKNDELELLFNQSKDLLTEYDKNIIKAVIVERIKEVYKKR